MRKFLLILLLAWLPAQSVWAAVSVYCQHEELQSARSAHVGHHEHEHESSAAPAGTSAPDAPAGSADAPAGAGHPDCSVCHGTAGVVSASRANAVRNSPAHIAAPARPALPGPPSVRPERPNWQPA